MPFAMTTGRGTYFLAYDQVGSLRVVADGSGNPVKRIYYDSFGNVFCDSDPNFAVPFGFAGGLYDKDTKLVRFGFRDYEPDTGRWTAKDPIGFGGGDSDLYGYCLGDPVNWADPLGLTKAKKIIKLGKKYIGKVMTGDKFKRPRVKVEKGGTEIGKIFADGTTQPENLACKLGKKVIQQAVDELSENAAFIPVIKEAIAFLFHFWKECAELI